jgi:hypothetical protein
MAENENVWTTLDESLPHRISTNFVKRLTGFLPGKFVYGLIQFRVCVETVCWKISIFQQRAVKVSHIKL